MQRELLQPERAVDDREERLPPKNGGFMTKQATAITTKIETITPAMAKKYLEKNTSNRPVRDGNVDKWAHAIQTGQWVINGETIKFSDDDVLLDGQHRLMAIIKTGMAVETIVVRGLPPQVYETIDTGSVRRPSDTLARNGENNSMTLSTVARYIYIHQQLGDLSKIASREANLVTTSDILETIDANPGIRESVSLMKGKRFLRPLLSDAIAGSLHYLFSINHPDQADVFFARLEKGDNLEPENPIVQLRKKLMYIRDSGSRGRIEKMVLTIKAFNLFVRRKTVTELRFRDDEAFPEINV